MLSKYLHYIIILSLLLGACNGNPTNGNASAADTTRMDTTAKKDTIARQWIVRDSSMYSRKFLDELYNFKDDSNRTYSLIDNYVVFQNDTSYFPDFFESNKQYLFEAKNDSADYKLLIFNGTYTKVQFDFSVIKNNKLVRHYNGEAEIGTSYFLAEGTDEDGVDSTAYGVCDYAGEQDKYSYNLEVGAKDDQLLAKFTCTAKDSIHNQGFNDCPQLRCNVKYIPKHKPN